MNALLVSIMRHFSLFITLFFFIASCSSSKPGCAETRELSINPEEGIGPYYLGMAEQDLVDILCPGYIKTEEKAWFSDKKTTYYFLENMSFVFRNDRLNEINVWGSFKGNFDDIGVDYDKELLEIYGEVIEHNGEYRILDVPHISFGKENSDEGKFIRIYK